MDCCGCHTDGTREIFATQPRHCGFVEAVFRRLSAKIRRDLVAKNRRGRRNCDADRMIDVACALQIGGAMKVFYKSTGIRATAQGAGDSYPTAATDC